MYDTSTLTHHMHCVQGQRRIDSWHRTHLLRAAQRARQVPHGAGSVVVPAPLVGSHLLTATLKLRLHFSITAVWVVVRTDKGEKLHSSPHLPQIRTKRHAAREETGQVSKSWIKEKELGTNKATRGRCFSG